MIPQPIDTVPLFQRLSEEERQLVTKRLKRRQAAPGEVLIAAGQPANTLFIITAGWIKLEGGSQDHAVTLANLGAGSLLGEVDMLLGRPYSMTAHSAAHTHLLTLSRSDLEDLINERPSIGLKFSASVGVRISFLEDYLVRQRLRNIELLSALPQDDLRAIAQELDFRAVPRGEVITEAGAPSDAAFLIEQGTVRLVAKTSEGESFEDLKDGTIFGHTALMTGKPYAATARAVTEVTLWVLPHSVYKTLIHNHPAVKLALSRALAESLGARDQSDAVERLRQLQLFADVPTDALSMLAARLVLRHFPADEAIYMAGTPGDSMYIVDSGEVRLMDTAFSDAILLERIRAGEAFGEMALLTGRTRAECARAVNDATVWVLYKSDFDDLMVQHPELSISLSRALSQRLTSRESDFVIRHLRRIKLFANLATSELKEVSKRTRGLRFRPGEIICLAGQPALTLYLIEKGEVKRMTPGPRGEPIILDILDAGDSFGEQEIAQSTSYPSTAQSMTETELWTIAKSDFLAMMEDFPALALTVTRLLADRLSRAQRRSPTTPGRPRPGAPVPPRPPVARPPADVRPPPPRVQQPPSGARPIRPATATPSPTSQPRTVAPKLPVSQQNPAPVNNAQPAAPSGKVHLPHIPTPHLPHIELPHLHMPHLPTPHLPSLHKPATKTAAPATTAPAAQPRARRKQNTFAKEFGGWLGGLSVGGKLRLLTLGMLAIWFLLIAFPWMTITTVSSAVGGLQLSSAEQTSAANTTTPESSSGTLNGGRPKVAFALPTNTPVPTRTPLPTFTPPRPQPTRILPTRTPAPAPAVVATAPVPAAPPLPAAFMDPRIGPGGKDHLTNTRIVHVSVPSGKKFWRITRLDFEEGTTPPTGCGDHNIKVHTFDENGKRIYGTKLLILGGEPSPWYEPEKSQGDVEGTCGFNFSYATGGGEYTASIQDPEHPSDKATGMKGLPVNQHVSYVITFKLLTMP